MTHEGVDLEGESVGHRSDHGFRFYGVVTLGNILTALGVVVPVLVWGIRLESRVDTESLLRGRLERQIAEQANDSTKRNDRIETLLAKINDDVTQLRIQLGAPRRPAGPPP